MSLSRSLSLSLSLSFSLRELLSTLAGRPTASARRRLGASLGRTALNLLHFSQDFAASARARGLARAQLHRNNTNQNNAATLRLDNTMKRVENLPESNSIKTTLARNKLLLPQQQKQQQLVAFAAPKVSQQDHCCATICCFSSLLCSARPSRKLCRLQSERASF